MTHSSKIKPANVTDIRDTQSESKTYVEANKNQNFILSQLISNLNAVTLFKCTHRPKILSNFFISVLFILHHQSYLE